MPACLKQRSSTSRLREKLELRRSWVCSCAPSSPSAEGISGWLSSPRVRINFPPKMDVQ